MTDRMTEQTDAAEVFKGHAYTYPDSFCECAAYVGGHEDWREHMAETLLASDWLAAREAAAEARGAERALREAAEEISGSDVIPLGRTQTRDWLRARAAAAGGAR